jgi:hypothetical protein
MARVRADARERELSRARPPRKPHGLRPRVWAHMADSTAITHFVGLRPLRIVAGKHIMRNMAHRFAANYACCSRIMVVARTWPQGAHMVAAREHMAAGWRAPLG